MSDAQLVNLTRTGAPGIEERLYERLAPVIHQMVWTLLGPDSEHEDVAHDVFLRILRGVIYLREAERLDHWASRVTLNAVRNELRRRRLRRWVSWSPFEDAEPLRYEPDLDGREIVARAYRVLDKMPPDERVILSLRLFQGGTLEDLARAVGCSMTTTKRRLRSARARFARIAAKDELLKPWLERSDANGNDDNG